MDTYKPTTKEIVECRRLVIEKFRPFCKEEPLVSYASAKKALTDARGDMQRAVQLLWVRMGPTAGGD